MSQLPAPVLRPGVPWKGTVSPGGGGNGRRCAPQVAAAYFSVGSRVNGEDCVKPRCRAGGSVSKSVIPLTPPRKGPSPDCSPWRLFNTSLDRSTQAGASLGPGAGITCAAAAGARRSRCGAETPRRRRVEPCPASPRPAVRSPRSPDPSAGPWQPPRLRAQTEEQVDVRESLSETSPYLASSLPSPFVF